MGAKIREFISSLADPEAQNPDAADTQPAATYPAPADQIPVQMNDDWKGHDDPTVGQNKAVDANDKSLGASGTWDFNSPPKVTGVYGDPPKVKNVNPNGDPFQYSPDKDTASGNGPPANKPSPGAGYRWDEGLHRWLPVPSPGPGYTWDPVMQNWRKDKSAASQPDPQISGPDLPLPKVDPSAPGDYETPDDDIAIA